MRLVAPLHCVYTARSRCAERGAARCGSRLDLSFNRIRTIANLETLVNLEELYLISNKISVIQGTPKPSALALALAYTSWVSLSGV